jgi:hypothetical protein
MDSLTDITYKQVLDRMGVQYCDIYYSDEYTQFSFITRQALMAQSIAELNDGVWIAKEYKPEVYQYKVVPAKGNEDYLGRWIGQEIEPGNWKWKPSNPWLYISGQLEVKEWHHILWSSKNAFYVIGLGAIGWCLVFVIIRNFKKNKNK